MSKFKSLKSELKRLVQDWSESWAQRHYIVQVCADEIRFVAQWGREHYDDPNSPYPTRWTPGPEPTEFGVWLGARADFIWFAFIARTFAWIPCWALGHDIVDQSYGGPDSGCMAGYCKRCGFAYHTSLY